MRHTRLQVFCRTGCSAQVCGLLKTTTTDCGSAISNRRSNKSRLCNVNKYRPSSQPMERLSPGRERIRDEVLELMDWIACDCVGGDVACGCSGAGTMIGFDALGMGAGL